MKTNYRNLLLGLTALLFLACNADEEWISASPDIKGQRKSPDLKDSQNFVGPDLPDGTGTLYGSPVTFNGTSVRSFVVLNGFVPKEIGYEMSNAAFNNLPNPGTAENTEFLIPLPPLPSPSGCSDCPDGMTNLGVLFNHLTLHWYPQGSEPAGIYSFPKFDFHCYTIPLAERMAIVDTDPATMIAPDPMYMAPGYYGPIGPMSAMGSHWVDLMSPEFNGGAFTRTFIYGSNNGKVVFHEMSVTLAFLTGSSTINDVMPIRQPATYARDGYYPTKYRISKNSSTTRIYLSDFVLFSTTGPSEI